MRGRFVELHDGNARTCARTRAGRLECFGPPFDGLPTLPGVLPPDAVARAHDRTTVATDVVTFDLDGESLCLVNTSGEVRCWGSILQHMRPPDAPPLDPADAGPPGVLVMTIDLATGEPCES